MDSVKRTNREWVRLFEQQRMRGQILKTWCAENNINLSTMSDRISRIKKAGILPKIFLAKEPMAETKWAEVTSLAVETEIQVKINGFSVIVPLD